MSEEIKTVRLQHSGSCTGMFWRGDPFKNKEGSPPSNDNWPRNGALLKGTGPHEAKGEKWFKVSEIQQAGTSGFKPVADGTWMLYEQHGPLLRDMNDTSYVQKESSGGCVCM